MGFEPGLHGPNDDVDSSTEPAMFQLSYTELNEIAQDIFMTILDVFARHIVA